MTWGIDGNAYALRQYERQQDHFQRMDDWLEEVMNEIYDDGPRLEQLIADSGDELDLEEIVEKAAREYIREQQEMKHECF
jgi:hypothetical protein